MNPEDEHPKPEEREKFTRAGRWKVPGVNPDQPDRPKTPLTRPVGPPPSREPGPPVGFTRTFQSPLQSAPPSAPVKQQPPPAAPPAPPSEPGAFTKIFQSPPSPPGSHAPPPARPVAPAAPPVTSPSAAGPSDSEEFTRFFE